MLRQLLRCFCNFLLATVVAISAIPSIASTQPDTLMLAIKGEPEEGYDPILGWGMYGSPLYQTLCQCHGLYSLFLDGYVASINLLSQFGYYTNLRCLSAWPLLR